MAQLRTLKVRICKFLQKAPNNVVKPLKLHVLHAMTIQMPNCFKFLVRTLCSDSCSFFFSHSVSNQENKWVSESSDCHLKRLAQKGDLTFLA